MKTHVLTCAVFPSEAEARKKMWIFLASCRKFGIEPNLYGVGRTFPGYKAMKLDMQLEYLEKNTEGFTHVLYTDGWDGMFAASLDVIEGVYRNLGSPSHLSAAWYGLANVSDVTIDYGGIFDESVEYRYPHVGGYLAERDAVIENFRRMLALPRQTGDDCFNHYDAWKEGWYRPMLDSHCRIFQSAEDHLAMKDGQAYNDHTGSFPCVLHISGGYTSQTTGKDERMIPWARRLGIIE